jgi:hypothetical protein
MTTEQILDGEIKNRVRKDDELKLMLAKANKVKVDTVNRWLREDDDILTTAKNLLIIRAHYKLPKNIQLTVSQ